MVPPLIVLITVNNWLTFAIGTVCNTVVIYLCFRITNSEIVKNKWILILQSFLQAIECINVTFLKMVGYF